MKYDTVVIGFGKAGKTLAATLAKRGEKVAVIEKSPEMYGGTCINVGCIPSKSLVTAAGAADHLKDAPFEKRAEYYAGAINEKRRVTGMLRKKNYDKLNDDPNIIVYDGYGRFISPSQIEVLLNSGGEKILEGEKIVINTGASPVEINIPGMKNNPQVYTSETLMDEEQLPERLTLIGAGYIGMEFASMYSKFGSKVTVLQDSDVFLPKEDRDVAEAIKGILEKQGVDFLLNANTREIDGGDVRYEQNGKEIVLEGDAILIATGRKANTEGLQAEKAGIDLTSRGAVKVDELLRTGVPNIWAVGDVNGGPQFTFISLDDHRIVMSQLNGRGYTREQRKNVPYSVFMDTPLGRVGITEAQAKQQEIPYRIVKMPTAAVPKAQVLRKTDGLLKAVIHAETGRVLGVSLLCPEAYEMVNLIKLAMDNDVGYEQLRDQIYTHPTMTEAFNDLFSQ